MLPKQFKRNAKEQKVSFFLYVNTTSGASFLGKIVTGNSIIRASKETIRAAENFLCPLLFFLILIYKNIIKMNLGLILFTEEIIYRKK